MKGLRVLVVGTSSPHVANYISRVQADDVSIHVISNANEFISSKLPLDLVDFSLLDPRNWFRTTWKIAKVIRSFKPDVIHIHQANAVAFYVTLVNQFFHIPSVLTAWGSDILLNPTKNWLLKIMVKFVLKRVDQCTADAQFLADEMQRLVPSHKLMITICNFGVSPLDIEVQKEKLIYSNRTHNKLYRIDEVINGFHRFSSVSDGANWKLIVAGKGSETEALKEHCKALGVEDKVEFVGFLTPAENAQYYARSAFFVSLPESDATAVSLLEAMYYKCVPILSNLPANKEWVTDGVNGIIADLNENYIERALQINSDSAGEMNRSIILERGTVTASKTCFRKIIFETANRMK